MLELEFSFSSMLEPAWCSIISYSMQHYRYHKIFWKLPSKVCAIFSDKWMIPSNVLGIQDEGKFLHCPWFQFEITSVNVSMEYLMELADRRFGKNVLLIVRIVALTDTIVSQSWSEFCGFQILSSLPTSLLGRFCQCRFGVRRSR